MSNDYIVIGKKLQESRDVDSKDNMEMISFCENVFDCRNLLISNHLGEQPKMCDEDELVFCDNCFTKVLMLLMSSCVILQLFEFNCNMCCKLL